MEEELYDEFGNLIGAESDDSISDEEQQDLLVEEPEELEHDGLNSTALAVRNNLDDAFSDDVEVLVETEDRQTIERPLVEPSEAARDDTAVYTKAVENIPRASYDMEYLKSLLKIPERIKNVAVLGALQSGKTSLIDMLVSEAHEKIPNISKLVRKGWKPLKYLDNTKLEIERGLSCKLNGFTFLGSDLQSKSVAITMLDSPGHVNFIDEVTVATAASDSCLIVIDVVEGVTAMVQQLIKLALNLKQRIVFVINKIDRLILELKLPPRDSYLKLAHLVKQIQKVAGYHYSPEKDNILFASAKLGFTFSISEFVLYNYSGQLDDNQMRGLVERLWGNVYFQSGKFSSQKNEKMMPTFCEFVLVPLYKIFAHTLSGDPKKLALTLKRHFDVDLDQEDLNEDPQPLLRKVLGLVFRLQKGLIHSINNLTSSAHEMNSVKLAHQGFPIQSESFLAHVIKLMDYCGDIWALVRVYQGRIKVHDTFRAIDAGTANDEDVHQCIIKGIGIIGGRYILPVDEANEGQIILINGIDKFFTKSGTITNSTTASFPPINYLNEPVFKIVLKALNPRELPLMVEGLNKINKLYPGMITCVEESGETIVLGTGELYLDCLLYDLRTNYAKIEIQVSNPLVKFAESCMGESFASIPVSNANETLTVSMGAQVLETDLVNDISNGVIPDTETENLPWLSKMLRKSYHWDSLAARNVWGMHKGNTLVNDTLPDDVDQELLSDLKDSIYQGFEWAIREGPLAEEPIFGVNFRILNFSIDGDIPMGQLISLVRKACYVAFLTAEPALLEPIYEVNVLAHDLLTDVVEELFAKRRGGRIYKRLKIPATPLVEIRGCIPVIDSIGFETDLRLATNGEAMCQLHFCKKTWRKVPGNVMDENAAIPKLKSAPPESMSRDFVMKTRRRKGLSSDGYATQDGPSLERYIDADLFQKLKEKQLL
ncbi:LADA_0E04302g1_1 [Lachancea dasiensis]|uniref:LADA_0E04302g1_1 n=1 Tax=Lachancea dasiensis TaxID=1072105 RepID=A0A1G4JBK5_9SACH|nr:LADA_0E04302g1_1 [Lachancea dasiensis]